MNKKLKKLSELEGYDDVDEFLADNMFTSFVPGICTNKNCSATYYVEPDQAKGHCEECSTKTVSSCLLLGNIL